MKFYFECAMTALNIIGLILSISMSFMYGQVSFSSLNLTGKYADSIGHKEFHCPKTLCAVSVFFPVNKQAT